MEEDGWTRPKEIDTVINRYKELTGRDRIKLANQAYRRGIGARLDEGYTVDELMQVMEYKFNEWWSDPNMRRAYNLVTLFRPSHFDTYLCEAEENLETFWKREYDRYIEDVMKAGRKEGYMTWEVYKKMRREGKKPS